MRVKDLKEALRHIAVNKDEISADELELLVEAQKASAEVTEESSLDMDAFRDVAVRVKELIFSLGCSLNSNGSGNAQDRIGHLIECAQNYVTMIEDLMDEVYAALGTASAPEFESVASCLNDLSGSLDSMCDHLASAIEDINAIENVMSVITEG